MLQYERIETILRKLDKQASVRVAELSKELGASESTIRRDITELDKAGRLRKVFGGAVSLASPPAASGTVSAYPATEMGEGLSAASSQDALLADGGALQEAAFGKRVVNTVSRDMAEKELLQTDEKTEVAAYAAQLIEDGDLIYIDAGTTTGHMIDHITCSGAVFVTNGVRHALRLAQRGLDVYLLSGRVKPSTEAVIGHEAVESLGKYHFSKCFMGTDGIDATSGLTTADIEESMVKTAAIRRSQQMYVLADSSKFGLVAAVTFAQLGAGTVITDHLPEPAYRSQTRIVELHGAQAARLSGKKGTT